LLWYLGAVIEMTAAANMFPGINEAAQGRQSELRRRWPDATPLGFYLAFAATPSWSDAGMLLATAGKRRRDRGRPTDPGDDHAGKCQHPEPELESRSSRGETAECCVI
jgi:hypothetical protein